MRRREVIAGLGAAIAWPHAGRAQQDVKTARVGFLGPAPASNYALRVEMLRAGLRDLGYIEGKNLIFELRWANNAAQLPELARELVGLNVNVIYAPSSTEAGAIAQVTKTTPVVFGTHADPVGLGHVASLARPGGNMTGLTMLLTEVVTKELEFFKEALPRSTKFGVLYTSTAPSHIPALRAVETAAQRLGVQVIMVPVQQVEDFDGAFATMVQQRVEGFLVIASSLTFSARALLAALALKHRLPSVFGNRENVEAGGLMSYAPNFSDLTRRATTYIDAILKGTKPADLPVEQASKFELVINLKTAVALGLKLPESFLLRADEVIE
jgi:putative tryptophan/tyrosine transport system substrate-binding protein